MHFYQPPRENPWLDEIEYQESAYPFHDWNERISVECYRANGSSRILDDEGWVVDITNNYSKASFNFGPTLLSWIEDKDPKTYEKILEGDRLSQKFYGGHGSAIAQCYNHMIMPLATRRDKETQVIWGLKDFERRFARSPEAMWLPETAVDIETLEVLSDHGMKYVILAPRQAAAIKPLNEEGEWSDVEGEKVDPREAYLVRLPSGRSIAAFFYDGPTSKAVAFEGLLHDGVNFARRLLAGFDDRSSSPQLMHIATDGETYGHHHPKGDMALAYALSHIEKNGLARLTNYGEFLASHPPRFEAKILEHSSWSCEHGVERWRTDCGCNSGGRPGWNQQWRQPLRQALDHLRERMEKPFEDLMKPLVKDPWAMRNAYEEVVADRSLAHIESFLRRWTLRPELSEATITLLLKALECQRHLLLMFTSCGWFFDELSGIETVQNLQYAYRAIELGESLFGLDFEEDLLRELEAARSNIPGVRNGREVFERYVRPARVDGLRVGIHFAVSSIFENFDKINEVYGNRITLLDFQRSKSGRAGISAGHARIRTRATLERQHILFGAVHLGDHNLSAGVKSFENLEEYQALVKDLQDPFERGDFPQTLRVIDRFFGDKIYSLKSLFKDEQNRILGVIMKEALQSAEERFRRLYEANYPLICYLADARLPVPKVFTDIAEFIENRTLEKSLHAEGRVKTKKIKRYIEESKRWGIAIDKAGFARDLELVLEKKMRELDLDEVTVEKVDEIDDLVRLKIELPSPLPMGPAQNWFVQWCRKQNGLSEEVKEGLKRLGLRLQVKWPLLNDERKPHGELGLH
jgi:alpha-amylase/alpha-mannosidase (GH57 family)